MDDPGAMLPFDEAVFEAHVRRLSPSARRAFLAAVMRAAGHEARLRDGTVRLADGTEVVFGQAEFDSRASGRTVTAERLAELLAYGMPDRAARKCCEAHLGAPPSALEAPFGLRARRRVAAFRPRLGPALGILLVLASLGVGGLGAEPPRTAPGEDVDSAVPDPLEERPTEPSVPPAAEYGVSEPTEGQPAEDGATASRPPARDGFVSASQ
jgi:hypothetical protein